MKYLGKYANLAAYEADDAKGFPNVSVIGDPEGEYEVKYEKTGNQCGYDMTEWDELAENYESAQAGDSFTMTETLCQSGTSEAWESLDPSFVIWIMKNPAIDNNDWVMTTTLNGETHLEEEVEESSEAYTMKFYVDSNTRAAREYVGEITVDFSGEAVVTTQNFVAGNWEYKIEKTALM